MKQCEPPKHFLCLFSLFHSLILPHLTMFDLHSRSRYDEPRTYSFDRSPHYHLISKAIQHRRQSRSSTDSFSSAMAAATAVQNGLPSPPIDGHFKMRASTPPPPADLASSSSSSSSSSNSSVSSTNSWSPEPTVAGGMTKADICVRLQELRNEKHRLFQLIKQQLVQQEEEEQRRESHDYFMHSQQHQHQQYVG
ncbi:hypothetical protein BDB00DRAFT_177439 [Zychaea mexicana]|uniref:uncharacterized protein n=1 Tax=Zychaea mexicana TaxID=64656 RepID=UPI0022FE2E57|nr:uncharacterized protein BDB00DRAFT_177439 [Zychaea mexicana]KAI9495928.1 hypothetical protein BDB00DRAFT_177439 [Zychaea mexicana]